MSTLFRELGVALNPATNPFLEDRAARVAPRLFSAEPVPCTAFQALDELDERTEAEKSADYRDWMREVDADDDRHGERP